MTETRALPPFRRVIRPNRSLSRKALIGVLGVYLATETVIVVGFLLRGAWPILPFAGLEILVIGGVLWVLARHRGDYERLEIDDQHLRVLCHRGGQDSRHEFQRYWTTVRLKRDEEAWYPSRLWVGSHGHFVEIGACLEDGEKEALARDLRHAIGR